MSEHLIRASSVLRRQLCPGSWRLEDGLPEERSELAAEGTLLHALDANPSLDRSALRSNQVDLLNISARLTREAFDRISREFGIGDTLPTCGGFEREMFLHRGLKSLFSGHCDVWEYFGDRKLLVVLEKKFGFKTVDPAESNMQTRTYACMGAELHDCDHVAVVITQPRLPIDQRLTLAVYTRSDIAAARQQLFDIWDACRKTNAYLNATEQGCRYCKAKLICSAYQEAVRDGLSAVPVPPAATVTQRAATIARGLSECSDEQLGRFLDSCTFANFAVDIAKEEARRRIREGSMVGWKLGKESEVREVTDVAAAIDLLVAEGLPRESVMRACKMSMGPIEEAFRDTVGGTWSSVKDRVNELLGAVIARHKKAPAVQRDGAAKQKALAA
jgi:hypothetical protein